MKRLSTSRRLVLLAVAATGLIVSGANAMSRTSQTGAPWAFQFLYTTAGSTGAHPSSAIDLWRGRYRVIGGRLLIQSAQPLAHVTGADGVLRLADGRLLVRSSRGRLLLLDRRAEHVIRTWDVGGVRAMTLDPSGRRAWIIKRSGRLLELGLGRAGGARAHTLRGPDTDLTALAFDRSGHAYYAARGGTFGSLNLRTFVTRRLLPNVPAARSLVFDRSSSDFVLVGAGRLVQIDPRNAAVVKAVALNAAVATATSAGHSARPASCGPAGTDGRGTLLVTCGRALAFVRMAASTVSVRWIKVAATSLAPTVLGRVDLGPYLKRRCRPHHCKLKVLPPPLFTG